MRQALPILFFLTLHSPFTVCVRINGLTVPRVVLNGTSHALLDCDYSLAQSESGLVVRWFLNSNPVPVYQWIPHTVPRGLGVLKGRVEPGAGAVGTPTAHRALLIRTPTTELSGDWKCLVSSFANEDFMTKRMVVFAREAAFELKASPVAEGGWTNVTCRVSQVYPEPRLVLLGDPDNSTGTRKPLAGVTVLTQARPADYDITAWAMVQVRVRAGRAGAGGPGLDSGTATVTCVLRVPEANHSRFETLDFLAGLALPSPSPDYILILVMFVAVVLHSNSSVDQSSIDVDCDTT